MDITNRGDEDLHNRLKIRVWPFRKRRPATDAAGYLRHLPQPSDIDTSCHFWEAFGNREKEISARWIVRLCQAHGSWRPFTWEELSDFYVAHGLNDGFWFNGLDRTGLVAKGEDGRYRVSEAFVLACYQSSPLAIPAPAA